MFGPLVEVLHVDVLHYFGFYIYDVFSTSAVASVCLAPRGRQHAMCLTYCNTAARRQRFRILSPEGEAAYEGKDAYSSELDSLPPHAKHIQRHHSDTTRLCRRATLAQAHVLPSLVS